MIEQSQYMRAGAETDSAFVAANRAVELLVQLDADEHSPGIYQPVLTAAYLALAETLVARGDKDMARAKLREARNRLTRAREFNPDDPQLAKMVLQAKELETLLR